MHARVFVRVYRDIPERAVSARTVALPYPSSSGHVLLLTTLLFPLRNFILSRQVALRRVFTSFGFDSPLSVPPFLFFFCPLPFSRGPVFALVEKDPYHWEGPFSYHLATVLAFSRVHALILLTVSVVRAQVVSIHYYRLLTMGERAYTAAFDSTRPLHLFFLNGPG